MPAPRRLSPRFTVLRMPTPGRLPPVPRGAGAVQAMRGGSDMISWRSPAAALVMVPVLALSGVAAVLAAVAAGFRSAKHPAQATTRTLALDLRPGPAFLVVGPITAIRVSPAVDSDPDAAHPSAPRFHARGSRRAPARAPASLPPVWFVFALAWCTAVAGWSQRELRVEAFSLPLGLALLGVGIIALRAGDRRGPLRLAPDTRPGRQMWRPGLPL